MNIKLLYNEQSFNIDIMEETPCQYLYRIAQKVFRKKKTDIILLYGDIKIENDSRLLIDVMGKEDRENILPEEIITVKLSKEYLSGTETKIPVRKSIIKNNISTSKKIRKTKFGDELSKIKKLPVKCQLCSQKNSIFYCRDCNTFVCFECNTRYSQHNKHKRINIEDGDTKLGMKTYKEKILDELGLIDSCYGKLSKWFIDNVDRDNFLQETFLLLDKIKKSSQKLSDIHTLYNINQDIINNMRDEINNTKVPLGQEELIDLFSVLNTKDKELENYIKCIDLQIIKTEYNKVLIHCISNAQKTLNNIIDEVESKLKECNDMKFWGIAEVKLYLKNHKNDKGRNNKSNSNSQTKKTTSRNMDISETSEENIEDEDLKKIKTITQSNKNLCMVDPNEQGNKNNKSDQIKNESNIQNEKLTHHKLDKNEKEPINQNDRTMNYMNYSQVVNLNHQKQLSDVNSYSMKTVDKINNSIKSRKKLNPELIDDRMYNIDTNTNTNNNIEYNQRYMNIQDNNNDVKLPYLQIQNTKTEQNEKPKPKSKSRRKSLIRALKPSFAEDNHPPQFYSPVKRVASDTRNIPPIISHRIGINMNNNDEPKDKYIQNNFKVKEESKHYGKKLVKALKGKLVLINKV